VDKQIDIPGVLDDFYAKSENIDKTYYQLMAECSNKVSFPLQNKKTCSLNEIFPENISAIEYKDQFYNEFVLKLLLEQYENITGKIVEAKTNDILAYINFYSYHPENKLLTITDFIGYKYYYEGTGKNFFDYYIDQCRITDKMIEEINLFKINSDTSFLNIPIVSIDGIYYDSSVINELQKSMKTVSPYLIQSAKNILLEGINWQTKIYSENIDKYVDWYYSFFTGVDKTINSIAGFFSGDKSAEEKFYTENFNRIMDNNANLNFLIEDSLGNQTIIIKNVFYE
jgi:hypothetical protein